MAEGRGCWKVGCISCGAAIVLLIGVPVLITGIALITDPKASDPINREFVAELPDLPAEAPPDGATAIDPSTIDPRELPGLAGYGEPVNVHLDLSIGKFFVEPAKPGEPMTVEAAFDEKRYILSQEYDDASRTYRVRFRTKGGFLGFFRNHNSGTNEIRVKIPRNYPIVLNAEMKIGESTVDLGGLSVLNANLEFGMGEHDLRFSEPLTATMSTLTVDGSMGEFTVENLGNASPMESRIEHSMGALFVDLSGNWVNDGSVYLEAGMGEARIQAPDTAHLNIERASVRMGERRVRGQDPMTLPDGAPTVSLYATASMGELRIDR